MPKGAEVIHVHEQDGGLFVWALACENNAMVSRLFNVYGAGHPLRAPLGKYRGTAHLLQGKLVLHVFDMGEEIDG